jgi:hypothetical protein
MTRLKPGDLVLLPDAEITCAFGFPRPFGIEQTLLSRGDCRVSARHKKGGGGCESVSDSQQTSSCPQ